VRRNPNGEKSWRLRGRAWRPVIEKLEDGEKFAIAKLEVVRQGEVVRIEARRRWEALRWRSSFFVYRDVRVFFLITLFFFLSLLIKFNIIFQLGGSTKYFAAPHVPGQILVLSF
jgi:hypothetical protein